MSYIDNLAAVYKTKVDAFNAMDHFRMAADLAKGRVPTPAPVPPSASADLRGLVRHGGLALLALAAIALLGRSNDKASKDSDGDEKKDR